MGAIYLFDADSYIKCNGYPNNIPGWGGDDTALLERAKYMNITIDRTEYNTNNIIELNAGMRGYINCSFNDKNRSVVFNEMSINTWKTNGLNTCTYTIESIIYDKELNYYHYLVNV